MHIMLHIYVTEISYLKVIKRYIYLKVAKSTLTIDLFFYFMLYLSLFMKIKRNTSKSFNVYWDFNKNVFIAKQLTTKLITPPNSVEHPFSHLHAHPRVWRHSVAHARLQAAGRTRTYWLDAHLLQYFSSHLAVERWALVG